MEIVDHPAIDRDARAILGLHQLVADVVAGELAAAGLAGDIAVLDAVAVSREREIVEVKGGVHVAADGPVEGVADDRSAAARHAELREQEAGGAVALDGPDQVRRVEDRRPAHLELEVVQVGVVVEPQEPVADLEAPVGDRLAAGGEDGLLEDQLVLGDLLDRLRLEVQGGLGVPPRAEEGARPGLQVVDQALGGDAGPALIEDDVALRVGLLGGGRVAHEIGLQARIAELDVHVLLENQLVLAQDGPGPGGDLERLASGTLADDVALPPGLRWLRSRRGRLGRRGGAGLLLRRQQAGQRQQEGKAQGDRSGETEHASGDDRIPPVAFEKVRTAQVTATPAYPTTDWKSPVRSPDVA